MLTPKQLAVLKKGNVSFDGKKSGERIPEEFKNASTAQKNEIIKLSGLSKFGFYKASASPKAIISMAQTLEVSPYYLSGETDDKHYSEDILMKFYKKCSSEGEKSVSAPGKRGRPAKAKSEIAKTAFALKQGASASVAMARKEVGEVASATVEKVGRAAEKFASKMDVDRVSAPKVKIDDESLALLLKSLSIRAKHGGEAEATYNKIVSLLLK